MVYLYLYNLYYFFMYISFIKKKYAYNFFKTKKSYK